MSFLWFLVVGLVAGWLAGVLVKGGGFGVIGDLVVGVIGAFLGGWLFSALGASAGGGLLGSIIVATVGAVVLLFIVRLVKRVSRPHLLVGRTPGHQSLTQRSTMARSVSDLSRMTRYLPAGSCPCCKQYKIT